MASTVTVHHGDSRDVLKSVLDNSVDAVACDPPYALVSIGKRFGADGAAPAKSGKTGAYARASAGFMGQKWDTGEVAFDPEFWREVLRVLKPGGYLVAAGGTRTYHRLVCAIEDAGFEIRDSILDFIESDAHVKRFVASLSEEQARAFAQLIDEAQPGGMLAWVYGSGFPKSHPVAKSIDRKLGVAGEKVATGAEVKRIRPGADQEKDGTWDKLDDRTYEPHTYEPQSTAAKAHAGSGTALKPACEPFVLARKPLEGTIVENVLKWGTGALNIDACRVDGEGNRTFDRTAGDRPRDQYRTGTVILGSARETDVGRWPANVVHDGSDEVVNAFPDTAPATKGKPRQGRSGDGWGMTATGPEYDDAGGSAARFFYTAKADAVDRLGSKHPTVKPVDLMAWLCKLITPHGGVVLDPFAGSGSTGVACISAGFDAILIEREADFIADIERRIAWAQGRGAHTGDLKRKKKPKAAGGLLDGIEPLDT